MNSRTASRMRTMAGLIVLAGLVFGVIVPRLWEIHSVRRTVENVLGVSLDKHHHIYDYARIMPAMDNWGNDIKTYEEYLTVIEQYSGIDIRIVLVPDTGAKSIEELALEKVQAFGIGRKTGEERGVLLLYDLKGKRLRVEVGYGLERYFPDMFVSYLVHDHAPTLLSSGEVNEGLFLLIRMLRHRILDAMLANEFDPTPLMAIRGQGHLSGGAGASAEMPTSRQGDLFRIPTREEREFYSAQPTPEGVYKKYLEWLLAGQFIPTIDIFTKEGQGFLVTFPRMSKAYFHFILLIHYGKRYRIDSRGNRAILYFTDDPILDPYCFVKNAQGWQMELGPSDTLIHYASGVYEWSFSGKDDIYNKTFRDKLVNIKGYLRIADGDNRLLPIRNTSTR